MLVFVDEFFQDFRGEYFKNILLLKGNYFIVSNVSLVNMRKNPFIEYTKRFDEYG